MDFIVFRFSLINQFVKVVIERNRKCRSEVCSWKPNICIGIVQDNERFEIDVQKKSMPLYSRNDLRAKWSILDQTWGKMQNRGGNQ